ncbi:hypothetical protein THRCLA_09087 [Thraustotheca clavata]|uniref:Helicase-associated domain-containing protein n=1 Tax=Thraustotheca clavata TaxID=74557 RepID=A0A1V9Z056_9STRA|nr:hypothetical protein THRCLA_09087 [Thraustotheca clavata]
MFTSLIHRPRFVAISRSLSSYKMPPSLQEMYANVAITWREVHRDTSDYAYLPNSALIIPNEDPWPEDARGRKFSFSYFRVVYRKNLLEPSIVDTLNRINFVWNVRDHNWQLHLHAFKAFKLLHGDLLVPANYIIPQSENYPKDVWGMKLGYVVDNLRRRPALAASQQDDLKQIGFIWDHLEYIWLKKVAALAHYKKLHGNLDIVKGYRVPYDESWPAEFHGMRLQQAIEYLRFRKNELSDKVKDAVDALGFTWDPWQTSWENKLGAIEAYRINYGHVKIPRKFVVPASDDWPQDTWGLKIGEYLPYMRAETRLDRMAQLEALGISLAKPRLPKELRQLLSNSD